MIEKCDAKVDHPERSMVWGLPNSNSRRCTRNAIENSEFCKVHTYNRNPVYRWSTGKEKNWKEVKE
jgi:hypothetical protein